MSLSAAKSRVMQATMQMESGRTDDVDATLRAAEGFLAEVPDDEKASVLAQIAAIRADLANVVSPSDARNISAATGKVRQARSQIDSGQTSGIADTLRTAEGHLDGIADALAAPVRAAIAEIRVHLNAVVPPSEPPAPVTTAPTADVTAAGADVTATGAMAGQPEPREPEPQEPEPRESGPREPEPVRATPSDDDAANISRARSRVLQARSLLESRRTENIGYTLDEAEGFLADVSDAYRAPVLAEIAAIRDQLGDAIHAEDVRRVEEELDRHLRTAETNIGVYARHSDDALRLVAVRLTEEDVTGTLTAARVDEYRARAADLTVRLAARVKADALDRALPLVDALEQRLATDPFAGLEQRDAYVATNELRTLKDRVLREVSHLPVDDADVASINARLVATDQRIDAASAAWGKAVLDARVDAGWVAIQRDIDGWRDETVDDGARPLDEPNLPKTRLAVSRIRYLLDSEETVRIRAENRGDATIEATYRAAEEVLASAATKLDVAFNDVLDRADAMPTPIRRFDLDRPNMLAVAAEYALTGTAYLEATVGRARRLDERWKAEVAAIMGARQELYDTLAVEADAAWPAIVDAIAPNDGFDPTDPGTYGTTVILRSVYNRSGWDFAGRDYDFSMRWDGVPIGGDYEPHVLAALEHAWYELKLDVSDRIAWDVVAVVEGPGTIHERTMVILKSMDTNLEIGKIEEWRPIDCVRLRIVALHAGPVAVGPVAVGR